MARKNPKKYILCIDGGGVRGIVPSILLQELRDKLDSRGKTNPLASYFDLIAGTSTGGIIALGLCARSRHDSDKPACSPDDLYNLYKNKSKKVFGTVNATPFFGITFEEKYSSEPLEATLFEIFGDAKVGDTLGNFLVTAYEIEQRKTKTFSNIPYDGRNANYYLRDLARATAAAPTFFEPARIEKLHKAEQFESLIDGGIFAANPSMVALMHAIKLGWKDEDIVILSLGTGMEVRPYLYHEVKKWGNLSWVSGSRGVPIVSMLMQSQTEITDQYVNLALNRDQVDVSKKRYLRIDGPLLKGMGSDDLDDKSEQNLRELELFAQKLINDADNQAIFDLIADNIEDSDNQSAQSS